jgi:hypothetical protein
MIQNNSDKNIEESYNNIKFLMKFEHTSHMTIDYTKLDNQTQQELREAINNVLHKRCNELASIITGVHSEFVVHNGRL